jgi:hypothetical protein
MLKSIGFHLTYISLLSNSPFGANDNKTNVSLKKHLFTCTPMFIVALFTIAKLWKQPRFPTTDEWIKKIWYLYTMEFYAAMKKNEMLSFAGK